MNTTQAAAVMEDVERRPRWPRRPSVYEINTWVWLSDLAARTGKATDLDSVPASEWDAIAAHGCDAVWLMGVWERSPAGIAIANQNDELVASFRRALPDYRAQDNVGSAYCVRRYVADDHLGGARGLRSARRELAARGMRLVLDYVPNHVAIDHPWAREHPNYFIHGTVEDARDHPGYWVQTDAGVYACGRDPNFPAWRDVLQLNAFDPALRQAVRTTLSDIAAECDGVRCDMAILLLNAVFERTWGGRAGPRPATEYWADVIPAIKRVHPDFLFIAEAYWGLEWELQQQGFDLCYDKTLYDRLRHDTAESIRLHLCADLAYQERLLRFIENHDEPRAAAEFAQPKERVAAVTMATLPGAALFHEGQFEGRTVQLPVFLGRRPEETADAGLQEFYAKLLAALRHPALCGGQWRLCERSGWPDNASYLGIVAWSWENGDARCLIVVNLGDRAAQARVRVEWPGGAGRTWTLRDQLTGAGYDRAADELRSPGLFVDLAPWSCHFLDCRDTQSLVPGP